MKKLNKQILEAVHRGIQLALDDYQNIEPNSSILNDIINTEDVIQNRIDLDKYTVDLGLPSGTRWCKYNLGVELNQSFLPINQVGIGEYYAWGETQSKQIYDWDHYKYGQNKNELTKYIATDEHVGYFDDESEILLQIDHLTELQLIDDAAYQNMHLHDFKFHIPTVEQFEELLEYTISEWTNIEKGFSIYRCVILTSKINGNKIAFPACGYYIGEQLRNVGFAGNYWTSTLNSTQDLSAYAFVLNDDSVRKPYINIYAKMRQHGLQIRPVIDLK